MIAWARTLRSLVGLAAPAAVETEAQRAAVSVDRTMAPAHASRWLRIPTR